MSSLVKLLGWRMLAGRGRRRTGLLVLLGLPVLLATAVSGIFAAVSASADQRATDLMGQASGMVTGTSEKRTVDGLRAELAAQAPGLKFLDVVGSSELPVWDGSRSVPVNYEEMNWADPATRGKYRIVDGGFPTKAGEIAVGAGLSAELDVSVGDSLPYRWDLDAPAKIVGVVESPLGYQSHAYLGTPGQLSAWPRTGTDSRGAVSASYGFLLSGDSGQIALAEALAAGQGLKLQTRAGITDALTMVEREPGLLMAPGVAILGVLASAAFTLRMRRIRSQFAVLTAIGLSDQTLRRAAVWGALAASLTAVPVGWLAGSAISAAVRPLLPSLTDRDISPYDPLLVQGGAMAVLSVVVAVLAATAASRHPAGAPPRVRARAVPARRRLPTMAPVLAGGGTLCLALSSAALEREAAAWTAVAGIGLLCAALLTRARTVLAWAARAAEASFSGRIALRALARDPRRPVSAVAVGAVSIAVAVGTMGTLSSVAAQDRTTYVGNRHLGQVEALLYSASPAEAVTKSLRGALPAGTPLIRGTHPSDPDLIAKAPSAALANNWRIAPARGPSDAQQQSLEIVDDADKFRVLTGREWTNVERDALLGGKVLVLAPEYLGKAGVVTLAVPTEAGAGAPTTSRTTTGVLAGPVDATTRTRAVAYVSSDAARAWGATPVDYSVIADLGRKQLGDDTENRLAKALESAGVPMSDVRIERGPEGPAPILWYLLLGLALAALAATLGVVMIASAAELRPDLVRLHRLGIAPTTIRAVVVWQSMTMAALAMAVGLVAGWGLTAARVWTFDAPVVMNWQAVGTLGAAVVALGGFYGALASPRRIGNSLSRADN